MTICVNYLLLNFNQILYYKPFQDKIEVRFLAHTNEPADYRQFAIQYTCYPNIIKILSYTEWFNYITKE